MFLRDNPLFVRSSKFNNTTNFRVSTFYFQCISSTKIKKKNKREFRFWLNSLRHYFISSQLSEKKHHKLNLYVSNNLFVKIKIIYRAIWKEFLSSHFPLTNQKKKEYFESITNWIRIFETQSG